MPYLYTPESHMYKYTIMYISIHLTYTFIMAWIQIIMMYMTLVLPSKDFTYTIIIMTYIAFAHKNISSKYFS